MIGVGTTGVVLGAELEKSRLRPTYRFRESGLDCLHVSATLAKDWDVAIAGLGGLYFWEPKSGAGEGLAVADWLILSDTPLGIMRGTAEAFLAKGLFTVEFHLPLSEPTVLIDYRSQGARGKSAQSAPQGTGEITFSVLYDPAAGISVLHRQGGEQRRYVLPGPLPQAAGVARLSLHLDAEATGVWLIRLELPGVANVLDASGPGSLPLDLNAMDRLCALATGSTRDPSVLWFGISKGTALPPRRSWIGRNTPVMTNRGLVFAEALRAGDYVKVLDHGLKRLENVGRIEVPSRGTFASVLLRTPFFGASRDLLISSDQLVLVGGISVEYVCGCDEVLIRSGMMVNGRSALLENRRSSTLGITLDFGSPVLLPVDGVALLIPTAGWGRALPRRVLADYEAHPLLPIIGAGSVRVNA